MSTILECKNLSKKYGRKQALDNITLSLESGKIIGLLGPNGSGKTTLIKLINGLLAPTGGKLFINGNTPGVESKKIVSYLPERTYLDETQKVSEAITLFEDFYVDFDRSRAISMLEKLNIDSNARIKTLSKGTKEKVEEAQKGIEDGTIHVFDTSKFTVGGKTLVVFVVFCVEDATKLQSYIIDGYFHKSDVVGGMTSAPAFTFIIDGIDSITK